MDLIIRRAVLPRNVVRASGKPAAVVREGDCVDIGIEGARIVAVEPRIDASAATPRTEA